MFANVRLEGRVKLIKHLKILWGTDNICICANKLQFRSHKTHQSNFSLFLIYSFESIHHIDYINWSLDALAFSLSSFQIKISQKSAVRICCLYLVHVCGADFFYLPKFNISFLCWASISCFAAKKMDIYSTNQITSMDPLNH